MGDAHGAAETMMKSTGRKYLSVIVRSVMCSFFAVLQLTAEKSISLHFGSGDPKVMVAKDELNDVLTKRGYAVKFTGLREADIILFPVTSAVIMERMRESDVNDDLRLESEGFSIRIGAKNRIWVIGADAAGIMYGGFELAEQIRFYGPEGVRSTVQNPYMKKRGMKFNIPLDVRTPSYSDMSDAGQKNIAAVWDFNFWKTLIDHLVRNRYNLISLWSLHPFPSMVHVPEYPDAALNDVQRSTAKFADEYSTRATGFDSPEILRNPETVLKITIDEKIAFWKRVMSYAKDRNIGFVIVTWNIYTYGINGKYGITDEMNNPVTKDYYRRSVRQMFLTYPDLAGIGITAGENMGKGREGYEEKEDWIFDSYGRGMLDAAMIQPKRTITFIHREHEAGAQYIAKKFAPLKEARGINFVYSFKYAKAHVMSSAQQPYHEKFLREIDGTKTFWTLRNDDNYYFRWGAPDFVREFVKNIPREASEGFYYGSDGYIWGKDYLSKAPETPGQLEIGRHWYHWMLWGRLSYAPELSNERLTDILKDRFPIVDAPKLLNAWQEASLIYPVTTGFHWGALDYQWYIEGCKSRSGPAQTPSGFHDVNRFITLPPHERSGYQSIPDFVTMTASKQSSALKSPLEVAGILHRHADSALNTVAAIDAQGNSELTNTIQDIESMAYLGKYYAFKISAAASLALYRATREAKTKEDAVRMLTEAYEYWQKYTTSAKRQYRNPLWTNRVGMIDWEKLSEEVKNDIQIARQ